jgi:hypothetical protein
MSPKAMYTYRDFASATVKRETAYTLVRWLLSTGRFTEFRLAEQYRAEAVQGAVEAAAEAVRRVTAAYHQRLTRASAAS